MRRILYASRTDTAIEELADDLKGGMRPTPLIDPDQSRETRLWRRIGLCALFASLCAGSHPLSAAEGPVAALQETLRKQLYYSGPTTGIMDAETRASLKRFQIHEGLPVSGEIDTATLQSLQAVSGTPPVSTVNALKRSDSPVRERAHQVVQSDREFLQRMEGTEAVAAIPPASSRQVEPPLESEKPAPPARKALPSEKTIPPRDAVPDPVEEVRDFVSRYLEAAERPTPERESRFYGEDVDYFDSGRVSKTFIEKDQQNYYRRWPNREFTLLGKPEVEQLSDNSFTVRFQVRYSLRSNQETGKGETENIVRLRRSDSGLKIVGIRERKVRR